MVSLLHLPAGRQLVENQGNNENMEQWNNVTIYVC